MSCSPVGAIFYSIGIGNFAPLGLFAISVFVSCSPVGAILYSVGRRPMNNANIFPNGSPVGAELYIPVVIFNIIGIEQ